MTLKCHAFDLTIQSIFYSSWFVYEISRAFFDQLIRLDSQTHGRTAGDHPLGRNDVSMAHQNHVIYRNGKTPDKGVDIFCPFLKLPGSVNSLKRCEINRDSNTSFFVQLFYQLVPCHSIHRRICIILQSHELSSTSRCLEML